MSDNGQCLDLNRTVPPIGPIGPINPEIASLSEVKSVLLLPLSSNEDSLGSRLGDLPYSREDEQLLMSVAGPATLDFHLSDDGVLTVAIGDATGHGLKAGTVVTATKNLFNHLTQESETPAIFQQSSRALKRMNLRPLFMAMAIAKVKGYQLTLGSAGMPPVLIYCAAQRIVEEISLRGVPLGSLTAYSYRELSLNMAPGDVVVLMSDGYPERFNGKNEMLDYGSAKGVLMESATLPPQEIIEVFLKVADKWAGGRPQDDDVTFVVLKVK